MAIRRRWAPFVLVLSACLGPTAAPLRAVDDSGPRLPRLYLIGDSTVKNGTRGQQGWGDPFVTLFDPTKIQVENRARGGRSSRTYRSEGLWERVVAELRPGDFVLIQFGHNDGGSLTGGKGRASLKGNGEETREVNDPRTGTPEVVHTYGWYLRKYVAEAKARGATPIVLSPVPRNIWKGDTVARAANDYGRWAAEAATQEGARFIDLNDLVARKYEEIGREQVASTFFGADDHTHTTAAGARVTAGVLAAALNGRDDSPLAPYLATPTPDSGRSAERPGK